MLELGALDVYVIPMSLHIPPFPRSNKGLEVDGASIVWSPDVSVEASWFKSPSSIGLLFSCKELIVGGGAAGPDFQPQEVVSGSQVVPSDSKR